jgi:hypothetical protein
MLNANDAGSNEYKEGWNNAICYLNDNFCITKRNGEAIQISFELLMDEKEIIEQGLKNGARASKQS